MLPLKEEPRNSEGQFSGEEIYSFVFIDHLGENDMTEIKG